MQPHRGTTVLILGILSILCCALLGIPAIILANSDLKAMNEGRMDPSGKGMTTAGMICGIIGLVLMVVGVILQLTGVVTFYSFQPK